MFYNALQLDVVAFEKLKPDEGFKYEPANVLTAVVHAQEALDQLHKTIVGVQSNEGGVEIMLYVDEAHSLVDQQLKKTPGMTLYDAFCSCPNAFLDWPIFTIFLSTVSHLGRFAPPGPSARFSRIVKQPDSIQAPITETPFDCAPNFLVKPSTLRLEDICTIEFMSNFGRPL